MALQIKQQLKLTQQLIMTPQLQQALKILQMPRLELMNAIQTELKENPVVDEVFEGSDGEWEDEGDKADSHQRQQEASTTKEIDWEQLPYDYTISSHHTYHHYSGDEDRPSYEQTVSRPQSLTDYLVWQLRLSDLDETSRRIGILLIGNLGPDGYLQADLEWIADKCGVLTEINRDVIASEPANSSDNTSSG